MFSVIAMMACMATMPGHRQLVPPPFPREFRGVWVATVDNIDWPSKRTLTTDQQKTELTHIMDVAAGMNLNAVILQVRPSADALYASKLEPWSEYLTGKQGRAPDPYYDPLSFAVQEAHRRGLELHCWFNPYRAYHPSQKGPNAPGHISRVHPNLVRHYGKYLWMDPGEPEVRRRSIQVITDVVRRYDIDGVHIDDYFYPYPEGGQDFPDETSWGRYVASGGNLSKSDWRRKNVDDFVHELYDSIKSTKKWVKFGISPFGIYRPGMPSGIKAGIDQYSQLYADARKWLQEGWCDYFSPQLYWPVSQTAQSFPALLKWWSAQNSKGRNLWPGLYTSRTFEGKNAWAPSEIEDQIRLTRELTSAPGSVHFSMKAFLLNAGGITTQLRSGLYSQPALIPASPWLDDVPPSAPVLGAPALQASSEIFTWSSTGDEPAAWWAVWRSYGGAWSYDVLPGQTHRFDAPEAVGAAALDGVAVAAVDRCGNMSKLAIWQKQP